MYMGVLCAPPPASPNENVVHSYSEVLSQETGIGPIHRVYADFTIYPCTPVCVCTPMEFHHMYHPV